MAEHWTTRSGHPATGMRYQEWETEKGTLARIVQDGHEVVSPTLDIDSVSAQYQARIVRSYSE